MSNTNINKTIKINPELFKTGSLKKTKKHKETQSKPILNLVNPNVIKKKLLDKIKERKNKDNQPIINIKTNIGGGKGSDISTFTDEFADSINYLSTLSKKTKDDTTHQKKKELLANKTVKNHFLPKPVATNFAPSQQLVSLDLPEELFQLPQQPQYQQQPQPQYQQPQQQQQQQIRVNTTPPPWGCLKNGSKPTFRSWTRKQRGDVDGPIKIENTNANANPNPNFQEREKKLEILKQKIKYQKQQEQMEQQLKQQNLLVQQVQLPLVEQPSFNFETNNEPIQLLDDFQMNDNINIDNIDQDDHGDVPIKKITKTTTLKKYTLGKSKTHKKVGILIKNKKTQGDIILAQKELRRKPMLDIKTHLIEHQLIRSGSSIPNDCARAIYESAYLSGDISNKNRDTMLHNFMNENK